MAVEPLARTVSNEVRTNTAILGAVKFGMNASGSLTATRDYDAFGSLTSGSNTGLLGFAGSWGYEEDPSGLKLLGHRWYDSATGRFLTRDRAQDGRNWYDYAANDPLDVVDPGGFQAETTAARNGREWHTYIEAEWKRRRGSVVHTEFHIPGFPFRADILDADARMVIEIKPDTPKAIKQGIRQAQMYAERMQYRDIQVWVYPPGSRPTQFKRPMEHVTLAATDHWGGKLPP